MLHSSVEIIYSLTYSDFKLLIHQAPNLYEGAVPEIALHYPIDVWPCGDCV